MLEGPSLWKVLSPTSKREGLKRIVDPEPNSPREG